MWVNFADQKYRKTDIANSGFRYEVFGRINNDYLETFKAIKVKKSDLKLPKSPYDDTKYLTSGKHRFEYDESKGINWNEHRYIFQLPDSFPPYWPLSLREQPMEDIKEH